MNKIQKLVQKRESEVYRFKPNQDFYEKIKINRKRWGQLYRGEKDPTLPEVERIADYFNAPISELINQQQS